jgi:hypothetical protein
VGLYPSRVRRGAPDFNPTDILHIRPASPSHVESILRRLVRNRQTTGAFKRFWVLIRYIEGKQVENPYTVLVCLQHFRISALSPVDSARRQEPPVFGKELVDLALLVQYRADLIL